MSYNIVGDMATWLQRLERAQNASNYYALRPQISCFHPQFRCFFPFLGSFVQNRFSLFDANLEGIV